MSLPSVVRRGGLVWTWPSQTSRCCHPASKKELNWPSSISTQIGSQRYPMKLDAWPSKEFLKNDVTQFWDFSNPHPSSVTVKMAVLLTPSYLGLYCHPFGPSEKWPRLFYPLPLNWVTFNPSQFKSLYMFYPPASKARRGVYWNQAQKYSPTHILSTLGCLWLCDCHSVTVEI